MPAANIIQLRQLLKEKMPELRLGFEDPSAHRQRTWPTSVASIDAPLQGGLPKGALSEILAPQPGSGSALLRDALIRRAAQEKQIIALIDGNDSFDATQHPESTLSRLLWIRCQGAAEALKAADLLLRDRNVSMLLLDLIANPASQLRKIPATTWFRFQRVLEQTSTVCVVFTPQPMVSPAQCRVTLHPGRRTLDALDQRPQLLLSQLNVEVSTARRLREVNEELRSLA